MNKTEFVFFLGEKLHALKNILIDISDVKLQEYKIKSNATVNRNGICSVYLACFKNQQDISVDLTIDLVFKQNSVVLDIDIYKSDGVFLENLRTTEIPLSKFDETKESLDYLFEQLVNHDLPIYVDFVLKRKE